MPSMVAGFRITGGRQTAERKGGLKAAQRGAKHASPSHALGAHEALPLDQRDDRILDGF